MAEALAVQSLYGLESKKPRARNADDKKFLWPAF
jgi:hypothetical protein